MAIILDLTEYTGDEVFQEGMPKKILLVPGKHYFEYDLHPNHRRAKWYKQRVEESRRVSPDKRADWPIGITEHMLHDGAKIIHR